MLRATLDALLDIADSGEILVDLFAIGFAQTLAEGGCLVGHEIEDTELLSTASGASLLVTDILTATKEAVKDLAWVGFGRDRQGRGFPGNVACIGATVTGVALATANAFGAEFQRRKHGLVPDTCGCDLVY